MVEEAVSEGESLLVFSQFTEICESIEKHIKHSLHYNTYYLHGGTTRQRREKMIEEFQNPETEPSVFILSLKAGGVGITLTKANHVFHFDRWWNPAVEEQASDSQSDPFQGIALSELVKKRMSSCINLWQLGLWRRKSTK
jgi:SNF2 family DNA or RNA helicase